MRVLDRSSIAFYLKRLECITSSSAPRWGKMSAAQLMPHLRILVEISLEERSVPDFPVPFARTAPFRWFILNMPWPKGAKAPEVLFPAPETDCGDEKRLLADTLQRFVTALENSPARVTRNPLLGPLPLTTWARLHARHLDHHLRQFGA